MVEVPWIELAHLTPAQRRAYVIADNKLALNAGWDEELLTIELAELKLEGFDLSLTGFGEVELAGLLDKNPGHQAGAASVDWAGRVRAGSAAVTSRPLGAMSRPVEALIPYARNARTHSEAQVAQIAGSIREFGFTNPVLLDGENGIIAGHGRVLAGAN